MKYFNFITIVLVFSFTSCDGRNRTHNNNIENLIESKLSDSFFVQTNYIPEHYVETITDTILSNGFIIKSKFFVDMNKNVLEEFNIDTIHYKHFYREFNVELTISKKENVIFSKLINKDFFTKHDFSSIAIMDDGILLDFEIIDYNSANVTFNFDYFPKAKDRLYRYVITIFEDGTFKVNNEFVIF